MHDTMVQLISDFQARIKELKDEGENPQDYFADKMEDPEHEEEPGCLFLTNDNAGFFLVTPSDIEFLAGKGFRAESDVLYHPDHWCPMEPGDGGRDVFSGLDGVVKAKSKQARDWARRRRLF